MADGRRPGGGSCAEDGVKKGSVAAKLDDVALLVPPDACDDANAPLPPLL